MSFIQPNGEPSGDVWIIRRFDAGFVVQKMYFHACIFDMIASEKKEVGTGSSLHAFM